MAERIVKYFGSEAIDFSVANSCQFYCLNTILIEFSLNYIDKR